MIICRIGCSRWRVAYCRRRWHARESLVMGSANAFEPRFFARRRAELQCRCWLTFALRSDVARRCIERQPSLSSYMGGDAHFGATSLMALLPNMSPFMLVRARTQGVKAGRGFEGRNAVGETVL